MRGVGVGGGSKKLDKNEISKRTSEQNANYRKKEASDILCCIRELYKGATIHDIGVKGSGCLGYGKHVAENG